MKKTEIIKKEYERELENKSLLLLSSELICIVGVDGYFLYVNSLFSDLLGYSEDELLSRPYLYFIHIDDHRKNDYELSNFSKDIETTVFENRYIHKDGTVRLISWKAVPDFSKKQMYCVGRDITKYNLQENNFKQTQLRFEKIFNNTANGIVICRLIKDDTGKAVDFEHLHGNPAVSVQAGYNLEEVIGKRASEMVKPEEVVRFTKIYENVVTSGQPYEYEQYFPIYNRILAVIAFHLEDDLFALSFVNKTELRDTEKDLLLFKDLVNNSNDAIYFINPESSQIIDANLRACFSTGYSREELLNMKAGEIETVLPDKLSWDNHVIDIRRANGMCIEGSHKRKDGSVFPVEVSVSLKTYADKEYMVALVRDITERKNAENQLKQKAAELRESEERYIAAEEIALMGNVNVNLQDRTSPYSFSPGFYKLFGSSLGKKGMGPEAYLELVHPDDREKVFAIQQKSMNGEEGSVSEHRIIKKDGSLRWILTKIVITEDEHNKPSRMIGIMQDITDFKLSKETMILKNKVFDLSQAALSIADANGLLKEVNPAFLNVWGFSNKGEVIDRPILSFLQHKYEAMAILRALGEKGFWSGEYVARRADGSTFIAYSNATAICDENGKITGYQSSVVDITERKKAELALIQNNMTYKSITDNLPAVLYQFKVNSDGTYSFPYVSEKVEEVLGISSQAITQNPTKFFNGIYAEDQYMFNKSLKKAIKKLEISPVTFRFMKGEEVIWLEACGAPRDVEPKGSIWDGILHDITLRRRNEKALEENEALLQGLLDNSPDMISYINLNNKISWANRTVLDLYPDAIGRVCVFLDLKIPCDNCPIPRAIKTGKFEKGFPTIHKTNLFSGHQYWETIAVPLNDSKDKVTGVLKISRNITNRIEYEDKIKEANKELENLAFTDALTGLINRKPFMDMLDKSISRAKRGNRKIALLFLDLENFKIINDIYGHTVGDELLTRAAEIINDNIKGSDFTGRIGGDEFVVCLNNISSLNGAISAAQKINQAFSQKIYLENQVVDLGVSIGVAIYPDDGNNADELLKNSDLAMYKAKKYKKNSYHLFSKVLQNELLVEQASRYALEKNEFKIDYQLIVDRNMNIFCAEALLRWKSPEFGIIMPNDFIPVLEKHRSIIEVGDWIFYQVCNKIVELKRNMHEINISVNMSQFQIEDDLFIDRIKNIITETGVDPKNIIIEITEKIQSKDTQLINDTLSELKSIGIGSIALDDFGIGYSSFSNLMLYPIDVVKIDKFFIDRLKNHKYSNITSALIALIKKNNLKIIAEGVETQEQFELLKDMGCDYFQGYYFSRPQKDINSSINID